MRRLDYTVNFAAPPEKIYQDFVSRQYWEGVMEAYRAVTPVSEITRFCSDESGTTIVFTQTGRRADLPAFARAVIPVDMVITREQRFAPYDQTRNQATGTYRATIPAIPGQLTGRSLITEAEDGCRLRISSVCKVGIPFLGGRLEELIMRHLTKVFDAEQQFTAEWVGKHH
jgi:hypothetical protein